MQAVLGLATGGARFLKKKRRHLFKIVRKIESKSGTKAQIILEMHWTSKTNDYNSLSVNIPVSFACVSEVIKLYSHICLRVNILSNWLRSRTTRDCLHDATESRKGT